LLLPHAAAFFLLTILLLPFLVHVCGLQLADQPHLLHETYNSDWKIQYEDEKVKEE